MKYLKNKVRFISLAVIIIIFPLAIYVLLQETNLFGLARGRQANIVVDASASYTRSSYVWKNLGQGGEENANQGQMLNSVVGPIKNLDPDYIRIDHIYDFYDVISRNPSGGLVFNWTKLDLTVKDIISTGARPFFALSYMPRVLSNSDEVDTPRNWEEWEEVVQRTLEHYSGVDGMGLANVYYEVWNEPDLFGKWRLAGSKNYYDLYYHSALGAQRAKNVLAYKIGGPATTALYENWFKNMFKFVLDRGLRFDFVSWHTYSTDLDKFEDDTKKAKLWLNSLDIPEKFKQTELIITEMGLDSEINPSYDTPAGAIHTLATIAVLDGKLDRAFSFEIKDGVGPTQFWGRWGILTHEKFGPTVAKPRYNAFLFLNRMEGRRLNVIGQGSWVKAFGSQEGQTYKLLLANYDPAGNHGETVPIQFLNIADGDYKYRRSNFLGEIKERTVSVENSTLNLTEYLAPNSASIIELSAQD